MLKSGIDAQFTQNHFSEPLKIPDLPATNEAMNVLDFMRSCATSMEVVEKYCAKLALAQASMKHFEQTEDGELA